MEDNGHWEPAWRGAVILTKQEPRGRAELLQEARGHVALAGAIRRLARRHGCSSSMERQVQEHIECARDARARARRAHIDGSAAAERGVMM